MPAQPTACTATDQLRVVVVVVVGNRTDHIFAKINN